MRRHSSRKIMLERALLSVPPCDFRTQVPDYPGNNDQRAKQDKNVKRLTVKRPTHHSDQGDAHKVQRDDQSRVTRSEGIAQTVMRCESRGADADRRENLPRVEMKKYCRITSNQRERKLDHRHPEYDAERCFGHREL